MKLKITKSKAKYVWILGMGLFIAAGAVVAAPRLKAASAPRDFDSNAVVFGGAYSKDELIGKINNGDGRNGDLKQVFYNENRGIAEQGIRNSVDGVVKKDGTVWVGGSKVANGVFSSGRSFIPGSTRDGSLWMRPPSVSMIPKELDAFVIVEGGAFKAAIIKSCGNPVKILAAPFPNVFKRVKNERTGIESDADTQQTAIKAKEGDKLTFTNTVTNQGTAPALDVFVKDILPTGLNLSDPNQRDASSTLGTILNQSKKFYFIKVTVAQGTAGKCIENVAIITARGGFKDQDSAWVCIEKKVVVVKQKIIIIKFDDKDHDGKKDPGENVIAGFKFRLDGKVTKTTNSKGEAIFTDVAVGDHKIEEVDIPSGFVPTNQNPFTVKVEKGKDVTRFFGNQKVVAPVKKEQNIKIIKFEDKNHDGTKDDGEQALSGFTFKLDDNGTKTTDTNGIAVFNNVTAGKHTITEINIPKGFIAVTRNPLTVDVPAGQTIVVFFGNQKLPAPPIPPVVPKVVPEVPAAAAAPVAEVGVITKGGLPAAGPEQAVAGAFGTGALGYAGYMYLVARKKFVKALKK